jgi:diguanylate cyclase (GGDEF)-like protein
MRFLAPIVERITEAFQGQVEQKDELASALRREGLIGQPTDPEALYGSIMGGQRQVEALLTVSRKSTILKGRFLALQSLVNELGHDPERNIQITTDCVRRIFGFSGVRVYDVDLERGTWHHRNSDGEQGISRFMEPTVPPDNSEKAFLARLFSRKVGQEEIAAALAAGLYEWHGNGGSNIFYIPDRTLCDFVEKDQVRRDEGGDPGQNRPGYGPGRAREIVYLVIGKQGDQLIDVVQITNWASGRDLFTDNRDKAQQMNLLHTFGTSLAKARDLLLAHQKLEDDSVTDPLTGLHNRRYFDGKIEREVKRARASRQSRPLGLLAIDIDHFKYINDAPEQGHLAGDKILREISTIFLEQIRKGIDSVSRFGGDEFMMILPETDAAGIAALGERIRKAVEAHEFVFEGKKIRVTVSIGGSGYSYSPSPATPSPDDIDSCIGGLIRRADNALYKAKRDRGRNHVVVAC